jgi:hypothetical protein
MGGFGNYGHQMMPMPYSFDQSDPLGLKNGYLDQVNPIVTVEDEIN